MSVKMALLPIEYLPEIYKEDRQLTPEEEAASLKDAQAKGLPEGWSVIWDNTQGTRNWITPDGKKRFANLPKALRFLGKKSPELSTCSSNKKTRLRQLRYSESNFMKGDNVTPESPEKDNMLSSLKDPDQNEGVDSTETNSFLVEQSKVEFYTRDKDSCVWV